MNIMAPYSAPKEPQESPHMPYQLEQKKANRGFVKSKNKNKKVIQPSQPKYKKTSLKDYLESLKESIHEEPICILLHDFILNALQEAKEESQGKLPVDTCMFISIKDKEGPSILNKANGVGRVD